jgi:sugar lactone lactonase YvrE
MTMRWTSWVAIAAVALTGAASSVGAQTRQPLDVRLFARVGNPGQPEPIAVGSDGNVYVATNQQGHGDASAPSRVFVFDPKGKLLRDIVIRGQDLGSNHGIQGLAFDGDGVLYALDRAARSRVIAIDPGTGAQRDYAVFRDVPPCAPPGRTTDCSATIVVTNGAAAPNWAAFARDGTLFVTDIEQALIWRVPKGGGRPEVWFTHPNMESVFGPNGIAFQPDGRTLVFAQTASNPQAGDSSTGRLYTVPVQPDGKPGPLRQLWESRPFDGPDGLAVARSGRIYVALAGTSQLVVVSPAGQEVARIPATPLDNQRQPVPFDAPASLAFLGDSVLVTNQSFPAGNPASWAVLDVFAGEAGLPLFRPRMSPPTLPVALRVTARPAGARAGRRTRFVFRVTTAGGTRVADASVYFAGRRASTNAAGEATTRRLLRVRGHRYAVVARKAGYGLGRAAVRLR